MDVKENKGIGDKLRFWAAGRAIREQKKNQVSGVGGWLLFLVLKLSIITPLIVLGENIGELAKIERAYPDLLASDSWQSFRQGAYAVVFLVIAINLSAGYKLWKERSSSVPSFAVTALWAAFFVHIAGMAIIMNVHFGSIGLEQALNPIAWLGQLFWTIIWTFYLELSERVKNTYCQVASQIAS